MPMASLMITRHAQLDLDSGWHVLGRDGAHVPLLLSSGSLPSAGKSGEAGAESRAQLLEHFPPPGITSSAQSVLVNPLSVCQVHSMDVLLVRTISGDENSHDNAAEESGVGAQIELLSAAWHDDVFVPAAPRLLERVWAADHQALEDRLVHYCSGFPADGILTDIPYLDLAVTVADCMPIFASCANWRAVLHSGWAGTGILRVLLDDFHRKAPTARVSLVFGPCISVDAYQVDADRSELFARRFGPSAVLGRYLNLRQANIEIARQSAQHAGGIRLEVWDRCTVGDSGLFSYRRQGPENYGQMLALYPGVSSRTEC